MKKIGSAADQLAFRLAIGQAETTLGGSGRPAEAAGSPEGDQEPRRPQEASQRRSEGRQRLPEGVRSLERARATQRAAEAIQLEALARKAGMAPDDAARLAQGLRAQIPNDWTFVMLSPSQNSAVVRWLNENSKRPQAATLLWARLFEVIRNDTGEIMQTRDELAQWLGVLPREPFLDDDRTGLDQRRAAREARSGGPLFHELDHRHAPARPRGPAGRARGGRATPGGHAG